jgi:GTPase SAR1 family protein
LCLRPLVADLVGFANVSNIFKIKSLVATGTRYDGANRGIHQTLRYYQAVTDGRAVFKGKTAASVDQQIKDITKDICSKLEGPNDEIFFFGFGRGAYIVRAVANLLHYMGLPKLTGHFDEAFQKALELEKARILDDSLNGTKLLSTLKVMCDDPPRIQFVGLFDTIKPTLDKYQYEVSFVQSIKNLRHALAFNETKLAPEVVELPASDTMEGRSFVQAWFMGTNQDIGGATQHDGLSLYPYQWMLLEAMKSGLILQPDGKTKIMELAFPHFGGAVPDLSQEEKIQWRLRYANGIQVTMFDLQSLHTDDKGESSHAIRHSKESKVFQHQRKIWNNLSKALLGWNDKGPWGNVVHHSVYSILDRNNKLYDQGLFKIRKVELADFEERCIEDNGEMAPWLDGLHLQASGVKAFRILVCGKTGVGKSTLINKVFGVEMTEESTTYAQGAHDINKAFESPNHPGLLIHDSRGWQAGSDDELDLIAKFLRHRAFQKDPGESLHVIWFCVDSDVSRIEEADKRTFQTIAQFSNHVPVFVVGTKKDKLVAFRKMQLLEEYMQQSDDYKQASKRAATEANRLAEEQFMELKTQLSQIQHYKADGFCCISKG